MKTKRFLAVLIVFMTIVFISGVANATLVDFVTGSTTSSTSMIQNKYTIGNQFTFIGSTSVTLQQLGIWDREQDGLDGAHGVAIYSATGGLLTSTIIPSGTDTELRGGYRWVNLTTDKKITLIPYTSYVIAAFYTGDGDNRYYATNGFVNPLFSYTGSYSISGGTNDAPAFSSKYDSASRFGGNFAVPIPSAVLLLGSGLIGIVAIRRRFSK